MESRDKEHHVTRARTPRGPIVSAVASEKQGKETFFRTTDLGRDACGRYAEIREACLVDSLSSMGIEREEMSRLAGLLRAMSGLYDQAARSAASL